jgi:hypothetical protein
MNFMTQIRMRRDAAADAPIVVNRGESVLVAAT